MAALNRPITATYAVNETVRVDTQDNEDHTFCGIMFPIRAKMILPIEQIVIQSVAVRGHLGDISIWISNETTTSKTSTTPESYSFKLSQKHWTKVYQNKHRASPRSYQTMDLTKFCDKPVTLLPGQVRMMYIHSTLESDTAIVYDNSPTSMFGGPMNRPLSSSIRYEDDKIAIHSGKAHLSFVPFGQEPIWGWGNAWRDRREFVGQLQYGTIYKLWHPERHSFFGKRYHAGTEALLMLQRRNTLFSRLPDECIYYILNMCRWDWFDDTSRDMKARYRRRKSLLREQQHRRSIEVAEEEQRIRSTQQQLSTAAGTAIDGVKGSLGECCNKNAHLNDEGVAMEIDDDEKEHAMNEEEDDEDFDVDDGFDDDNEEQEDEEDDDNDDDDQNDDEDSNASSAWERAHGYRADSSRFIFHNVSSDEEEIDDDDDGDDDAETGLHHHPWFGRRAVRQVVVRALGGATRRGVIR